MIDNRRVFRDLNHAIEHADNAQDALWRGDIPGVRMHISFLKNILVASIEQETKAKRNEDD